MILWPFIIVTFLVFFTCLLGWLYFDFDLIVPLTLSFLGLFSSIIFNVAVSMPTDSEWAESQVPECDSTYSDVTLDIEADYLSLQKKLVREFVSKGWSNVVIDRDGNDSVRGHCNYSIGSSESNTSNKQMCLTGTTKDMNGKVEPFYQCAEMKNV